MKNSTLYIGTTWLDVSVFCIPCAVPMGLSAYSLTVDPDDPLSFFCLLFFTCIVLINLIGLIPGNHILFDEKGISVVYEDRLKNLFIVDKNEKIHFSAHFDWETVEHITWYRTRMHCNLKVLANGHEYNFRPTGLIVKFNGKWTLRRDTKDLYNIEAICKDYGIPFSLGY